MVVLLAVASPYIYLLSTDYSYGHRMGTLTKFDADGYIFTTGEGQLLLGSESSPLAADYHTQDGFLIEKNFNPWQFSTKKALIDQFTKNIGKKVWVRYAEHNYNISFRKTAHEALEIGRVEPLKPIPPRMETGKPFGIGRSEGVRSGRIVKASAKGKIVNTYEIVLQMGEAGNQFKALSINEKPLYDYAVECLKRGLPVTVKYIDQGLVKINLNDTSYIVYAIETAT